MKIALEHKAEFEAILKDYRPDAQKVSFLQKPEVKIVLLFGPMGAGRNTIINMLVETGRYEFIISHTTRPPRENDGVMETEANPYYFRTEEQMLELLKSGDMLEAMIIHQQQVSGVSIPELLRITKDGQVGISEVQQDGIEAFRRQKPDVESVFVLPPSFDEWLGRLEQRGLIQEDELVRRMQSAVTEFNHAIANDFYRFVVNDDLESAVAAVDSIATKHHRKEKYEQRGREKAEILLEKAQAWLEKR